MRNSYIISHNEYPAKYSFLTACLNSMDPVKNIEKLINWKSSYTQ